ncbi:TIGR03667 family PPOX class F420-dependent oxidoreductase [soil metagenome]
MSDVAFLPDDQVRRRLTEDRIAWLTTVSRSGRPSPRPVWFLWTGEYCVIYSQPDTAKLAHIAANDQVSLHFDSGPAGGDIVVIGGRAELLPEAPPADRWPGLLDKYAELLTTIGMTAEHFVTTYTVALRFVPERAWTIPGG